MTFLIQEDNGKFRNHREAVYNGDKMIFLEPPYNRVPELMDNLFEWMNNSKNTVHPLILSSVFHYEFVFIHPFSDGNGRTGRLIMLALMLENNLTPFVITVEDRAKYMDILRGQDIENFINLVEPLIEKEKKRISAFNNSSNLQI